jgi:polyphosphate:AMP phosphotransferase
MARYRQLRDHPETAWRVSASSRARLGQYDAVRKVAAHVLRLSSTAEAPWIILDGSDDNYRKLAVGRALRDALAQRAGHPPPRIPHAAPLQTGHDRRNVLSTLDLSLELSDRKYERELARLQGRLAGLMRHRRFARHSLVLAFEGMDAAGKGGAIRRVSAALDPRIFQIVPVAAPSDEERAQPWLWRFWRRVPGKGRVTIFDRSWYGRVLVERIEGFCSEADWLRAYAEICDFEHELVEAGAIVLKFWLQIDKAEQLRRFREREQTSWKQFKITQEDWRNRGKWAQYQEAAVDMIDRTGTGRAPWITIEANDKRHARIKILRSICEAVEHAMGID